MTATAVRKKAIWKAVLNITAIKRNTVIKKTIFFENAIITKPTIAAVITVGITGIWGALCIFLFWLTVAAWLYQAAMLSAMNGVLWLTAGLLGNVFAVVVFLLTRSFIRKKCPSCGSFQSVKVQYCSSCGKSMNEKCSVCGEVCMHGDRFCPSCGKQRYENES